MKLALETTFISKREFTSNKYGNEEKKYYELNWLVHNKDGTQNVRKDVCTVIKYRKMLDYRGIPDLVPMGRYVVWYQDYKGNRVLRISGINNSKF